jgi:hypothetical protein
MTPERQRDLEERLIALAKATYRGAWPLTDRRSGRCADRPIRQEKSVPGAVLSNSPDSICARLIGCFCPPAEPAAMAVDVPRHTHGMGRLK